MTEFPLTIKRRDGAMLRFVHKYQSPQQKAAGDPVMVRYGVNDDPAIRSVHMSHWLEWARTGEVVHESRPA